MNNFKSNSNCCVPGCKSVHKNTKGISYHIFPKVGEGKVYQISDVGKIKKIDKHKAWCNKLGRKLITHHMKVCSLHFVDDDYIENTGRHIKKSLKKDAVPSQNLPDIKPFIDQDSDETPHKSDIPRHKKTDGSKPFECTICHKKYSTKSVLKLHTNKHTGENLFKCTICDKKYISRAKLKLHICSHTGEKLFECTKCDKKYTTNYKLKQHIIRHTDTGMNKNNKNTIKNTFECDLCGNKYASKCYLKLHINSHTGENLFECKICNQKYRTNANLMVHIKTHIGERSFKCQYCEKAYTCGRNLNLHEKTHTGENLFNCKLCHKKYASKSHLKRHLKAHASKKREFDRSAQEGDGIKLELLDYESESDSGQHIKVEAVEGELDIKSEGLSSEYAQCVKLELLDEDMHVKSEVPSSEYDGQNNNDLDFLHVNIKCETLSS